MDQAWLSVLYRNARSARLNPVETLRQAAKLHIAYSNPIDRFAVFRFLMALLYWCRDKTGIEFEDGIPNEWFIFLSEQPHLFELLGDGNRFLQERGLSRLRPVTDLFHEIPTGNNSWHFRHIRDYATGVCPHCCVNGILRTPVFVQSGIQGMKTGVNGIPPIYSYYIGKSLKENIILNWEMRDPAGEPFWASPQFHPPDADIPYLAGLTTPGRKLYLHDPVPGKDACIICGNKGESLVYRIFLEPAPDINNKFWRDPFVLYRADKDTPFYAENILGSGRTLSDRKYRHILSEYYASHGEKGPVCIELIGFSSEQMKYNDAWSLKLDLDRKNSEGDHGEILAKWDIAVKNTQLVRYKPNGIVSDRHENLKKSLKNDLLPDVESKLLKKISSLLLQEKPDWDEAIKMYQPALRSAARMLVPGVGAKINLERNRILYSLPDPKKLKVKGANDGK